MIIQIAGAALIGIAMVCGTWYAVTIRKLNTKKQADARRQRMAHNERLYVDSSLALYQQEEARRQEAEVRIGIQRDQLRRKDKEIERLQKLIKELEGRAA